MRKFMLILISAIALAIAPTAASAQSTGQQIPVPGPILTKLGHTPMVELWDGGGGLPYLGSSTSYNAGDWESNLRAYATDDPKVAGPSVYEQQIGKVDAVAAKWLSHSGGRYKLARRGAHKRGVKLARVSHKRHGHKQGKRAIVFDVDETALSNYSAIDLDNFTFGDHSKAEATDEIGKAIPPTLALYKLAQKKGIATFFITGRGEAVRDHTASNLKREGFTNYNALCSSRPASRARPSTTSRARGRRSSTRATGSWRASAISTPTSRAGTRQPHSSCRTRSTSWRKRCQGDEH
jgi:hypothetical protein